MRIRNNTSARIGVRENGKTVRSLQKNLEKLSSGLRINRAGDDAAGLAVSEKMRANITSAARCQKNVQEGLDLTRTADGALAEVNDMLCRAKHLCLEAANGVYSEQERASVSSELNALFSEIDRIAESSVHNTIPLFRGDPSGQKLHSAAQTIREEFGNFPILQAFSLHSAHIENVAASPVRSVLSSHTFSGNAEAFAARSALTESAPVSNDDVIGKLDFIQEGYFDLAEPPKPATVTFTLADDINLDDASTLSGRWLQVGWGAYYFTDQTEDCFPTYNVNECSTVSISLTGCTTVKDALDKLKNRSGSISDYTLADRKVTLTAPLTDLYQRDVEADGGKHDFFIPKGNGVNTTSVASPCGPDGLKQVDGQNSANNQLTLKNEADLAFKLDISANLTDENGRLTADAAEQLKQNKITMKLNGKTIELDLSNLITSGMTQNEIGIALAKKFDDAIKGAAADIGSQYNFDTPTYDPATGQVNIGITADADAPPISTSFQEVVYTPSEVVTTN